MCLELEPDRAGLSGDAARSVDTGPVRGRAGPQSQQCRALAELSHDRSSGHRSRGLGDGPPQASGSHGKACPRRCRPTPPLPGGLAGARSLWPGTRGRSLPCASGGRLARSGDGRVRLPHRPSPGIRQGSGNLFVPGVPGSRRLTPVGGVRCRCPQPSEITLCRPFYPYAPGGTRREHLHLGLGLAAPELRRRCEGTDAGTLFWTLGGKQVGRGALAGWQLLAAPGHREPGIALWPFAGPLPRLLDGGGRIVVVETYPREYYQYIRPPGAQAPRWSKRRRVDRLTLVPACSDGRNHLGSPGTRYPPPRRRWLLRRGEREDEFDFVIGLLAMIGVVTGAIPAGEPLDDAAITTIEGWILGRSQTPAQ